MNRIVARRRLANQLIASAGLRRPADVVAWFGAVQAQEYEPAKWGLALRMRSAALNAEIERAFEQGTIVRTHIMRPTWHFVSPADIGWMLQLTAPRVHRAMAGYNRQLGLDGRVLARGTAIVERALGDGQFLTRRELGERLRRSRVEMDGPRLGNLLMYAELEAIVCSGPRRGSQSTYALLTERCGRTRRLLRDEALAELSRRYFRSHGPATARDFAWWSGLTMADARRGLEMNGARGEAAKSDGQTYWTIGAPAQSVTRKDLVHLLPIYDEYLVAYRDRTAVPHNWSAISSGSIPAVTFQHALVIAGQVAGTWRTTRNLRTPRIDVIPRRPITARERRALARAAARYEAFLGMAVEVRVR